MKELQIHTQAIAESKLLTLPHLNCITEMGTKYIHDRIKMPTTNIDILMRRQQEIINLRAYLTRNSAISTTFVEEFDTLKSAETILNSYVENESSKTAQEQIFFTSELTKPLNHIPFLLSLLLFLKIYITPILGLLTPLFLALSPYFIINYVMNMKMTWEMYIHISKQLILGIGPNEPITLKHLAQIVWFIASIGQTMFQPILTSRHTYNLDKVIYARGAAVQTLIDSAKKLRKHFSNLNIYIPCIPDLPNDKRRLIRLYEEDVLIRTQLYDAIGKMNMIYHFASQNFWTPVHYSSIQFKLTDFYDLTISAENAIKNSVSLEGHSLLTGPNRGGKSSVLRGILQQIILGQTIGFTTAREFYLTPFDWIHTRLQAVDLPGKQSLFEHEVAEVKSILSHSAQSRGFVCIDELFHSTNPPDGEFSARIFLDKLWKCAKITSIISTHTFSIVQKSPETIQKLCVFASEDEKTNKITYTYKLQNGECYVSSVRDVLTEFGLLCG